MAHRRQSYHVPLWDQYVYLSTIASDILLRMVIRFDGPLDVGRLRKAIVASYDTVPIAGCEYDCRWWRPRYVRRVSHDPVTVCGSITTDHPLRDAQEFLLTPFDPRGGPMLRALLMRDVGAGADPGDILCLKMSHLMGDATGCREYVYRLMAIYRQLGEQSAETVHMAEPAQAGEMDGRGLWPLVRCMGWRNAWRVFRRPDALVAANYAWHLPLLARSGGRPTILFRQLDGQRMRAIRQMVHAHNATVNDVLLTAFYRALYALVMPEMGVELSLPVAVDWRRYLPQHVTPPIANLAYYAISHIGRALGDTFADTLALVRDDMNRIKSDWGGMGTIPTHLLPIALLPSGLVEWIANRLAAKVLDQREGATQGPPSLNNFGRLDPDRLSAGDATAIDAFMMAAVVELPSIQVGVTRFGDKLTLSIMTRAVGENRQVLNQFLDEIVAELPAA